MSARSKRLATVLDVEKRRVEARERAKLAAHVSLERARGDARAAERALDEAHGWTPELTTTDALLEQDLRRRALEAQHLRATAEVERAEVTRQAAEQALVGARIAERKIEIVLEGQARAARARQDRLERRLEDEHAARGARRPETQKEDAT